MVDPQLLHRVCAATAAAVAITGSGCGDSKQSTTTLRNVERELRDSIAPPGSYVSASIVNRIVKLSQPAMRITRVTLNARDELAVTFIALRGGEEKTDKIPLNEGEATYLRKLKSVPFVLGGDKAQMELIPFTETETGS